MKKLLSILFLLAGLSFAGAASIPVSSLNNTSFIKGQDLLYVVTTNTGNATNYSRNITFAQFIANLQTNGVSTNAVVTNTFNPTQFTLTGGTNVSITNGALTTNLTAKYNTVHLRAGTGNELTFGNASTDQLQLLSTGGLLTFFPVNNQRIGMGDIGANHFDFIGVTNIYYGDGLSDYILWSDSSDSGKLYPVTMGANIAFSTGTLTVNQTNFDSITVTQRLASVQRTLAYSTTNITVDTASANVFLLTLTNDTSYLPQPQNIIAGQTFYIHVVQDATGGRALAYDTNYWKFSSNNIPVISTNANAWDILSCVTGPYGTNIAVVHSPRFR